MPWHVITKEQGGVERRSTALVSEKAALIFARELIAAGMPVLQVEGDGDIVAGTEILDRLAALQGER